MITIHPKIRTGWEFNSQSQTRLDFSDEPDIDEYVDVTKCELTRSVASCEA
jgi:hypothetical protein